ncbi:restriction endonuclease subunit S [Helicobacter pylori]|uniref:restriction endonuclease subunit S n=1 Tax=Helicobacter pylori TaxID=210 RepID=UPI000FDD8462|nr:restriction endonuclease subunit S [Helicobacter pylori]RVZ69372.1 restriction endonuclease subunit S [Helicobacter pylori]WQW90750.1 restriction endonuclease subunit S [Helicobacter pylori]
MIGPLSSQLNAIKWGEFKLGDLFEIEKTLSFNKDALTQGQDYDYITRTSQNQGVLQTTGFVNEENLNPPFTWSLGLLQMDFFYRKKSWYAGQFMRKITPKTEIKNKINSHTAHYFTTLLNALKRPLLSVLVRDIDKTFREQKIQLPLKPTANAQTLEDIDFDFMEKFIAELEQCRLAELEQCRLAELEAYLKATGLENTTLSKDEENALNVFNNFGGGGNTPCGLTWQSFKLGDLFEVLSSKKIYHANTIKIHDTQIENSYPYVVRAATNNGIKGFIIDDPTFTNEKNTLSFAQDTFTVFYQEQPYFTGNKVKILKPKFAFKSPKILHFISAILQFILKPLTWGLGSTTESIAEFKISLPLKPTAKTQTLENIDFNFMCTLINALMKQIIQGVVQYCGAKIQATKEVISQETPIQKDSLF